MKENVVQNGNHIWVEIAFLTSIHLYTHLPRTSGSMVKWWLYEMCEEEKERVNEREKANHYKWEAW